LKGHLFIITKQSGQSQTHWATKHKGNVGPKIGIKTQGGGGHKNRRHQKHEIDKIRVAFAREPPVEHPHQDKQDDQIFPSLIGYGPPGSPEKYLSPYKIGTSL